MRHKKHGALKAAPDLREPISHRTPRECIQGPQGLIQQHDLLITQERAQQGCTLPHATGKLIRVAVLESIEAEQRQQPHGLVASGSHVSSHDFGPECEIVDEASPGQQPVALRHIAYLAEPPGLRIATQHDLAGIRLQQPGNEVQERALAAAARSDERDELALTGLEAHLLQRRNNAAIHSERFADSANADNSRRAGWHLRACRHW